MPDRYASTFFALSIEGGVAHLEMNYADKANAMSPEFWADLPRLAGELGNDPAVRAVVLSGRGRHFSGGMDLAAFQGILGLTSAEPGCGAEALFDLIRRLQAALSSLEELRVPVIAAIHGVCLGGGVDLACACDIRIASAEATLAAALALAREIAAKSPLAIAGTKRAITYARDHSVADSLGQIALWNAGALRPEDLMKAIQARMAKQKAEFADLLPPASL